MKLARFALPVIAGVSIFGATTAFAASLGITGPGLGAGNATVASCNATATISYATAFSSSGPLGYKVTTAPITSAGTCSGKAFKATLSGAAGASLGEVTGTLDTTGAFTADFTTKNVDAGLVTGVSVVISG